MAPARVVPTTLVNLHHEVLGVAQDGNRIAWAVGPCGSVTVRDLRTGKDYGFHGPDFCQFDNGAFGDLALIRNTIAWWASYHADDAYQWLGVAKIGGKQRDGILNTDLTDCSDGSWGDAITGLGAGGASVLYSYVDIEGNENGDGSCGPFKKHGGVFIVSTTKRLSGPPPATALAVSGNRIAVVPLDPDLKDGYPDPAKNGTVEVWDTRTGRHVTTATVSGTARSVALTGSVLAVLARSHAGLELERFNPISGAELGTTPVPNGTSPRIVGSGKAVVYSVGRQIWWLDGATRKSTLLATASSAPVGLSVQRGRIVWGENAGRGGRILALRLP
jgi:hypothetical protein